MEPAKGQGSEAPAFMVVLGSTSKRHRWLEAACWCLCLVYLIYLVQLSARTTVLVPVVVCWSSRACMAELLWVSRGSR